MPENNENERLLQWALKHVAQAQACNFFGKLTISLEGGRIVRIVSESSIVPPKLTQPQNMT